MGCSRLGIGPALKEAQDDYFHSALRVRLGRPELVLTLGAANITDGVGNRFAPGTPFQTGTGRITPQPPRTVRLGIDAAF